jgi:hypothetical protein
VLRAEPVYGSQMKRSYWEPELRAAGVGARAARRQPAAAAAAAPCQLLCQHAGARPAG